jgi:hypothetical protein
MTREEGPMLALPLKTGAANIFIPFLEWCYERVRASLLPLDREHFVPIAAAPESPEAGTSGDRLPDLTPYYDASLLFRHLERLRIDRDELANDDPLLFRELQGRCTLCPSKERCAQELAADMDSVGWENWQAYCPNARTLDILGAIQNCGWAAQYLKRPRSVE